MSGSQERQQRPVARPVASSTDSHPRRPDVGKTPLAARNTTPDPSPRTGTAPRTGRRDLQAIRDGLNARDLDILRSVSAHRFLTTRHIEVLHFSVNASPLGAARSSRRVLSRLGNLRVLTHLERRVGGIRAGSAGYVWAVGAVGDRLLQADNGNGVRQRQREPSVRLLDHTLTVADLHVALAQAARRDELELVAVQVEPGSWRRFLGPGGEARLLRPDLAVVTAQGDYEDHWFLEADLGTEHPPTVVRKCQLYEDYRASGTEQETHGVFPRVLWVVPDHIRANKLTAAIRSARLDSDLFRVVTADQLVPVVIGGAA